MKRIGLEQMKTMSIDDLIASYRNGYRLDEHTPLLTSFHNNFSNIHNKLSSIHPNIYTLQGPLLDPVVNFGKVTVSTGYDALATSIVLGAGEGSKLPNPSVSGTFNIVWWNSTDYPDPSDDPNKEIVRCTTRVSDTLTVTRSQEGTSASVKNLSGKTYKMILSLTAKTITDISSAITARVAKSGDTMTGTLNLPLNGLVVGTNQLATSGSNVGIGTTNPVVKLEVSGGDISIDSGRQIQMNSPGDINWGIKITPNAVGLNPAMDFRAGGSNGYFRFIDSPGIPNVRMIIEGATGNVGIGTTVPSAPLTVVGLVSSTTAPILYLQQSSSNYGYQFAIDNISTGNLYLRRNSLGTLTTLMSIDPAGNVGVGITTPQNKLDVYGAVTIGTYAGVIGPTNGLAVSGNVGIGTVSPGYKLQIRTGTNLNLQFRTSVSDPTGMMIVSANDADTVNIPFEIYASKILLSNGNVGIGTSLPQAPLEVAQSGNNGIFIRQPTEALNNPADLIFLTGTGNQSDTNIVGHIRAIITQATPSVLKSNMQLALNSGDSEVTVMTLTSDKNVGIGTTSPGESLHIVKDGDSGALRCSSYLNSNGQSALILTFSRGSFVVPSAVQNNDILGKIIVSGMDTIPSFKTAGAIQFEVDGTPGISDMPGRITFWTTPDGSATPSEKMRITNAGNVGIGTTTPTMQLDIANLSNYTIAGLSTWSSTYYHAPNFQLQKSRSSTIGLHTAVIANDFLGNIVFKGSDGDEFITAAIIRSDAEGTIADNIVPGRLVFLTANSSGVVTEAMRITSAGNVGIGTTDPGANLHIKGASAQPASLKIETLNRLADAAIALKTDSGTWVIGAGTAVGGHNLVFYEADVGNPRMVIQNTGNIGIGTTNPQKLLHILTPGAEIRQDNGSGYYTDLAYIGPTMYGAAGSSNNYIIATNNQTWGGSGGGIIFSPKQSEAMRINSSGNVGIGITNPAYKLDVNGGVRQQPIIDWSQPVTVTNYQDSKNAAYYSAYTSTGVTINGQYPDGTYYLLFNTTGNPATIDYKLTGTHMSSLYIRTTGANYADAATRTASIKYSFDNGVTFTTLASQNFAAASFDISGTINFLSSVGGFVIIRLQIDGGSSGLVGWSTIQFIPTTTSFSFVPRFNNLNIENNVGIGTTTPQNKLDVYGAVTIGAYAGVIGPTNGLAVSGNVGIGTVSPGAKLEIVQPSNARSISITHNASTGHALNIEADGLTVGLGLRVYSNSATISGTGEGFVELALDNINASQRVLRIDNDGTGNSFEIFDGGTSAFVVKDGGNVGIGATGPGAKLEVSGDIYSPTYHIKAKSVDYDLFVAGARGSAANLDKGYVEIYDTGTAKIVLDSAGNSYLNGGNVGIGTTNPSAPLHVVKDNSRVDILADSYFTGSGTQGTFSLRKARGSVSIPSNVIAEDNLGFLDWEGYVSGFSSAAGITSYVDSVGTTPRGRIEFWTRDTSETIGPKMVIKANGNVGIGTTNPQSKLQINISSNVDFLLTGVGPFPQTPTIFQSVGTSVVTNSTDSVVGLNLENTSQTNNTYSPLITFSRKSVSGSFNSAYAIIAGYATGTGHDTNWMAGDLIFYTAGLGILSQGPQERLRITGTGNVGIGTTTPTSLLDVHGTAQLRGYVGGTGLTVDAGGNVGIGSTSPNAKLDVNGNILTGGDGYGVGPGGPSANQLMNIFGTGPNGDIRFLTGVTDKSTLTGGSEKVRILVNGNVGIGTTNPSSALEINRSSTSTFNPTGDVGTVARFTNPDGATAGRGVGIRFSNTGDRAAVLGLVTNAANTYGDIVLKTYNGGASYVDAVTVLSSGNVGIGTNNPSHALHVAAGSVLIQPDTTWSNGDIAYLYLGNTTNFLRNIWGDKTELKADQPLSITTSVPSDISIVPNNSVTVTFKVGGNVGIGTTIPQSTLDITGSLSIAILTITTNTTLSTSHYTVLANATTLSITVTLPTAIGIAGRIYNIKKIDATANTVTIATTLSQTVDGATTRVISTQYETITVQSDGANWYII